MRVAFVSTEAVPYTKVGGLADVAGSLAAALRGLGVETTVVLPWYESIRPEPRRAGVVRFAFEGHAEEAGIGELEHGGVPYVFIGLADFARPSIYGYGDDVRRSVRFGLAAAAAVGPSGPASADLIHAHDWQGGLLPLLARSGRVGARTVFTIHNLHHQGTWGAQDFFRWTGLGWDHFTMDGVEFHGGVNLMKAGIVYADRVTTVSPSYLAEIRTPGQGEGLEGVLVRHGTKLGAILNGIDTAYWDPASDGALPARYDKGCLDGKAACRRDLRGSLGLDADRPVLGVVSRFAFQKGIDLILDALPLLLELGLSLAVLGSGDVHVERAFAGAAARAPSRVAYRSGYDEPFSHRIYGGADAILMPSRFEPCGLVQMIAQRYGTPPIARAAGGLKDTITDGVTGFLFDSAHAEGVITGALRWLYHRDKAALGAAGMERDFSWSDRAREYLSLYRSLVA